MDTRETIGELLDLAFSDQEQYVKYGSPQADFGSDPDSARVKADTYRRFGQLGESVGLHGERERWDALAGDFLGSLEVQQSA